MAELRLIEVLAQLIEQKFKTLNYKELAKILNLVKDLELLFGEILKFKSLKQLNAWIDSRLPAPQNDPNPLANLPN